MAILNVTPDSFYDGGTSFSLDKAIEKGIRLFKEGADLIDIGGESSRPGAAPVSESEELQRTIPVIKALRKEIPLPISIDTTKPAVAEAAIKAGASLINDISGFENPEMQRLAAESGTQICVMHMQGTPTTMQNNPLYPEGICIYLKKWFEKKIEELISNKIDKEQIIIDPGIGFGKTVLHNCEIINHLNMLKKELGLPILLGTSRKWFMSKILNKPASEILSSTIAVNSLAIIHGIDYLRVHDVIPHYDAREVLLEIINNK